MTTKNIQDLKKLLADANRINERLAGAVKARAAELVTEQAEADGRRERAVQVAAAAEEAAAVAGRARRQSLADDDAQYAEETAERNHEAGQLRNILDSLPGPSSDDPQGDSQDEPQPAPVSDIDDDGDPDHPVVVVQPAPEDGDAPRHRWCPDSVLQWILAILGALIGIAIATKTAGHLFADVGNKAAFDMLCMCWGIVLTAFGFYAGGWLGWIFEHRHRPQH